MDLSIKQRIAAFFVIFAVFYASHLQSQSLTVTTFAGPSDVGGIADGTGSAARLGNPRGVAVDSSGNVYVSGLSIRKITPEGRVTTLAGLAGAVGSADGTESEARFNGPFGLTVDASGTVYVADSFNYTIRRITPRGEVTTVAGVPGSAGSSDGVGGAARFNASFGVATDRSGNVYVADTYNSTIRKITPNGTVTTFAGVAGQRGSIDGTGTSARFSSPTGIAVDNNGNLYVADDSNHTIRKISPAGVVTTFAGLAGQPGSADGPASAARFRSPKGVAIDRGGNVYVGDWDNHTVRKISPSVVVSTLAGLALNPGSRDGSGSAARFDLPYGVAVDGTGNVYVADQFNHAIRKITPGGAVTTLAGPPEHRGGADGMAGDARFNTPLGLATDSARNVYVADMNNHTIRRISPDGTVTTLAGLAENAGTADGTAAAARFSFPKGVAIDNSGNMIVADSFNHTIRKIMTPNGEVTMIAGSPRAAGTADGLGSAARFNNPSGVTTDRDGNVYVADTGNHTIRKINAMGEVTTLAGLPGVPDPFDGSGNGTPGRFRGPRSVATDANGNVYVADHQSIRKVSPAGLVTTLRGSFSRPDGVATDSAGNVYLTDYHQLRMIRPSGELVTLAGYAIQFGGSADGTGEAALFANPSGIAIDSSGNIYVADSGNNTIRLARLAIGDAATIDASPGTVGATQILDTAPQTASSWQWTVIRRPADSVAELSSPTVRNPTFTPDVPGLFRFRLVAAGATGASLTTVNLMAETGNQRRRPVRR